MTETFGQTCGMVGCSAVHWISEACDATLYVVCCLKRLSETHTSFPTNYEMLLLLFPKDIMMTRDRDAL